MSAEEPGFAHRFVPGEGGSGATLLLLHGTGGDENDLLSLGKELAPGAAILSPRGKVLEHGMPRFFRRLSEGVFDEEDLKLRTRELADFVEEATGRYEFDPGKVFAVGFSNGANIAASLLLSNPGLLRGAVLFRPMVPFEPEEPPDLSGVPIFVGAGQMDQIVPRENTERLAELLEEAGAEVRLHWQPGGHGLGMDQVGEAREWLGRAFEGREGAA